LFFILKPTPNGLAVLFYSALLSFFPQQWEKSCLFSLELFYHKMFFKQNSVINNFFGHWSTVTSHYVPGFPPARE